MKYTEDCMGTSNVNQGDSCEGTDIKQALQAFVAGYPDVPALVANGKLIAKGGDWYEVSSAQIWEELGSYAYSNGAPRIVGGKARVKLKKLPSKLAGLVSES